MADEIKKDAPNAEETENSGMITLEDEDGKEIEFDVLSELDYNGVHYVAVTQHEEQPSEDGYVVIFSIEHDEDGEYYAIVEDDELLLKLGKLFDAQLGDDVGIVE